MKKTNTITIEGNDYKIKQTLRALFLFEQISGKPFAITTTTDHYLYLYCILLANNPDFMDWNQFVDALDNDPQIAIAIAQKIDEQSKIDKMLDTDETDSDGKKKD